MREDFGTAEDFKTLVKEAHERGIKVVMDMVPNHTSSGHAYFQDAQKKGKSSDYFDYYARDKKGNATPYFDWEHLPNLNFSNPKVAKMMTDDFAYWMKEFGVDGFRADAAWGITKRNPEFWPELEKSLSAINPDVFLLAEASAKDPYYVKNGFDSAYDWSAQLGHWAWEKVFDDKERVGEKLRRAIGGEKTPPEQVTRFLNNNDTGERFITRHGAPATRVAAALLHTLPGLPLVYTGDEFGAEYEPYQDPPSLDFSKDPHQLRPLYKKLAELREEVPALHSGNFTELKANSASTCAFTRETKKDGALVLLNFGAKKQRVQVALSAAQAKRFAGAQLVDAITGKPVQASWAGSKLTVEVGPSAPLILRPVGKSR